MLTASHAWLVMPFRQSHHPQSVFHARTIAVLVFLANRKCAYLVSRAFVWTVSHALTAMTQTASNVSSHQTSVPSAFKDISRRMTNVLNANLDVFNATLRENASAVSKAVLSITLKNVSNALGIAHLATRQSLINVSHNATKPLS